jgi:RimJ/RimL family protein N-acetyltransferase
VNRVFGSRADVGSKPLEKKPRIRLNRYGQPIGSTVPGWRSRKLPPRKTLKGRYCRVEPVDPKRHGADLYAAYMEAPDDRDWTYLFDERPEDREAFRSYVEKLARSDDPLHFAIVELPSHKAVGTAALMRIHAARGTLEVGWITFSPRLKRTAAATESMYLLMRLVFDELGYRRYEWKCDSLNAPSRAAAERYGFTFEGIFRNAVVYKGRNRDTAWYAIVDQEWPRLRSAFEAWLDPANFDAQGRQKRSLRDLRG